MAIERLCSRCQKKVSFEDDWRRECPKCNSVRRAHRARNAEHIKEYWREYYRSHPGLRVEDQRRYREVNAVKLRSYRLRTREMRNCNLRRWKKLNPDKVAASSRRYYAKRKDDIEFRFRRAIRQRLRAAITVLDGTKKSTTPALLGCSIQSFKMYIESKFQEGMSFANYGEWELDHIIPCALFDLTDPQQQKYCFHFSNIQPLWRADNARKSASTKECGLYRNRTSTSPQHSIPS